MPQELSQMKGLKTQHFKQWSLKPSTEKSTSFVTAMRCGSSYSSFLNFKFDSRSLLSILNLELKWSSCCQSSWQCIDHDQGIRCWNFIRWRGSLLFQPKFFVIHEHHTTTMYQRPVDRSYYHKLVVVPFIHSRLFILCRQCTRSMFPPFIHTLHNNETDSDGNILIKRSPPLLLVLLRASATFTFSL